MSCTNALCSFRLATARLAPLGISLGVLAASGAGPAEAPATQNVQTPPAGSTAQHAPTPTTPITRTIRIPNTTVDIELVKVPPPPGSTIPLWVGRTEITWDQYDVFVYGLDEPSGSHGATGADAIARPSKPYVPPDRGFGHNGFPAMGMTHHGATSFCAWLTAKVDAEKGSGVRFRLPTEAEWEHLALAGDPGHFACADEPSCLEQIAWFADNSERATKPVGGKRPNAFGLVDVHGNVAEWVAESATSSSAEPTSPTSPTPPTSNPAPKTSSKPKPLAKGGSYLDSAERCAVDFDLRQTSAWNTSDPQIPKSTWWLADCPFVGFRIVMEEGAVEAPNSPERR